MAMQILATAMQNLSMTTLQSSHNDRVSASLADSRTSCPPSLAEGVRGRVSCHTTNIPSLRKSALANSWQSTKNFCHTERSEVPQNAQINGDISRSRAQYDKETSVIASVATQRVVIYNSTTSVIARICDFVKKPRFVAIHSAIKTK